MPDTWRFRLGDKYSSISQGSRWCPSCWPRTVHEFRRTFDIAASPDEGATVLGATLVAHTARASFANANGGRFGAAVVTHQ